MSTGRPLPYRIIGPDADGCWSVVRTNPDGGEDEIGHDGGEPEDQLLVRDWDWVVPELNRVAAERDEAALRERSALAAWLRRTGRHKDAEAVERAAHWTGEPF